MMRPLKEKDHKFHCLQKGHRRNNSPKVVQCTINTMLQMNVYHVITIKEDLLGIFHRVVTSMFIMIIESLRIFTSLQLGNAISYSNTIYCIVLFNPIG